MNPVSTVVVDQDASVKYRGRHRDISWEVQAHNFKTEPRSSLDLPAMWTTYVVLSEEMHDKLKSRINGAPWNGGQTYYRKITEEHVDASAELKKEWGKPHYRVGDDFSHLWDYENFRYQMYDRRYMEQHIKNVINYLIDGDAETE